MKGGDCIKSTEFVLTIRATCLTIFPGEEALNKLDTLVELMTYEDEFAEETKVLGFLYDETKDTLYLHKGVDIEYLMKMIPNMSIQKELYNKPKRMKFEYEEIIPPRNDEQVDVINFIAGLNQHSSNIDARQLFLIKQPGFG